MNEDSGSPIADALTATADGVTESGLLLGYVVVSEWMTVDGDRYLSQESGTGHAGDGLPKWQVRGYLNEALNHWPEPSYEEEEE